MKLGFKTKLQGRKRDQVGTTMKDYVNNVKRRTDLMI